jgi:hypothetical protein
MSFIFTLVQCLWPRLRALPQYKSSCLVGSSLTRKYKTRVEVNKVANTLDYYDTATITAVKSLKVQAPGVNVLFSHQTLA